MIPKLIGLHTPQEFYENSSLYSRYEVENTEKEFLYNLLFYRGTMDSYCIECKEVSVFKGDDNRLKRSGQFGSYPVELNNWDTDIELSDFTTRKIFTCSRNSEHQLAFFILVKNKALQKIGQYPSIAEINSFGISKYKKVLGKELFYEFNRAIGLFSHGVGVGSFVYLRRIIENFIIQPAYEEAKKQSSWLEEEYQKKRVKEKIKSLDDFLPEYLVANSAIYSIISKGIHELSEEDCLEFFPVLRECLEFVLTDLEAKRQTDLKKKEMAQKIQALTTRLN